LDWSKTFGKMDPRICKHSCFLDHRSEFRKGNKGKYTKCAKNCDNRRRNLQSVVATPTATTSTTGTASGSTGASATVTAPTVAVTTPTVPSVTGTVSGSTTTPSTTATGTTAATSTTTPSTPATSTITGGDKWNFWSTGTAVTWNHSGKATAGCLATPSMKWLARETIFGDSLVNMYALFSAQFNAVAKSVPVICDAAGTKIWGNFNGATPAPFTLGTGLGYDIQGSFILPPDNTVAAPVTTAPVTPVSTPSSSRARRLKLQIPNLNHYVHQSKEKQPNNKKSVKSTQAKLEKTEKQTFKDCKKNCKNKYAKNLKGFYKCYTQNCLKKHRNLQAVVAPVTPTPVTPVPTPSPTTPTATPVTTTSVAELNIDTAGLDLSSFTDTGIAELKIAPAEGQSASNLIKVFTFAIIALSLLFN